MKTLFPLILAAVGILLLTPLRAQEAKTPKVDVFAMTAMPNAKYSVKLELRQLDGQAVTVELEAKNGRIRSTDETGRLGKVEGGTYFIGNGVCMVQLRGKDYAATQYWCFQPDGTVEIKEVPNRGEKQTATVVEAKAPR